MKTLAVYGTLKKGYPLHSWLEGQKFLAYDKVNGTLYKSGSGWIPYLLKRDKGSVRVEVYEVDDEKFNAIKSMEEGAGYKTEQVKLKSGTVAHVFFYPRVENFFKKINKF